MIAATTLVPSLVPGLVSGLVSALVAVTLTAVVLAAAPASSRSRLRALARRRRHVCSHPRSVTSADIVARMRREGVDRDQARFVVARAARLRVSPFTMWLCLEQFGARALGVVVAADVTSSELIAHLCEGTVPDLDELTLFASINGLELTAPVVPDRSAGAGPGSGGVARRRLTRSRLPAIHEPGSWPAGTVNGPGFGSGTTSPDRPPSPRRGGPPGGQGDVAA